MDYVDGKLGEEMVYLFESSLSSETRKDADGNQALAFSVSVIYLVTIACYS